MPFPLIGAAIAGGASLIGGAMANRSRAGQSQKDRDFQGQQAGRQMRFQERMRNSEWQAAVADMEKAGINPALAYSQGGASSPVGARGSGSRASQEDVVTPAVSSALQYKRLQEEINAIKAGVLKTEAETDVIESRPGRIFTPAVDAATEGMRGMFGAGGALSPKNMNIVKYEVASSAKSIQGAIEATVARIKRALLRFAAPTIGPLRVNPPRRR